MKLSTVKLSPDRRGFLHMNRKVWSPGDPCQNPDIPAPRNIHRPARTVRSEQEPQAMAIFCSVDVEITVLLSAKPGIIDLDHWSRKTSFDEDSSKPHLSVVTCVYL